jgi:hypothetical protein
MNNFEKLKNRGSTHQERHFSGYDRLENRAAGAMCGTIAESARSSGSWYDRFTKFLVFSLIMFIFQLFMIGYFLLNLIAAMSDPPNLNLTRFASTQFIWISDALTFGNSIALFACRFVILHTQFWKKRI